jgi:outer membrane protein assembly factor BamB
MRRTAASICLGVAVVLGACGEPGSLQTPTDLLFIQTAGDVAVVEPGASSPAFRGGAIPSSDWSTVVRSVPDGSSTEIIALDPSNGKERWDTSLPGNLRAKVVSNEGDLVALGPTRERHHRLGRRSTTLVIVDSDAPEPRTITLAGNYEPEAFSTDGQSLFVIKYSPARAPTSYQVRRLDLHTQRVEGVYTPDAHLQGAMGGTARIQAASPDGRRLYTLYTLGGGNGRRYAFIHVLSLDQLWAHCIDLPGEFATSPEAATALTVSPDGTRLYVANHAEAAVAQIDTSKLEIVRSETIRFGFGGGRAYAAHDSGSKLYLASGRRVALVDTTSLNEQRSWLMKEKIRGLQVAGDGKRLFVAFRDRVAIIRAATGEGIDTIDPPGVRRIDRFGPQMPALDDTDPGGDGDIVCAC